MYIQKKTITPATLKLKGSIEKGARVFARVNSGWCKYGEIGLVIHVEHLAQTLHEYWILFQEGGLAVWPESLVLESMAVSKRLEPTAQNYTFTTPAALTRDRLNHAFRF